MRTRRWMRTLVRSRNCSSLRRVTKLREWATLRGHRTSARWRAKPRGSRRRAHAAHRRRRRMKLLVNANSPNKEAALAGLERWKRKHRKVVKFLAVDDVLVDSMRGRSSTWTRIRVNLRNVPDDLRPPQETPDPDDDPTREWRERWGRGKRRPPGKGE